MENVFSSEAIEFLDRLIRPKRTYILLGLMTIIVFGVAVYRTRNLEWAPIDDFARNQAQSQAIVDGNGLNDPAYRNTKFWYPPLLPLVIAGIHEITNIPLGILWARSGAYLNLFGIFTFFGLGRILFGHITALLATGLMLFITCFLNATWICACYSAAAYPNVVISAVYYLALALHFKVIEKPSLPLYALIGGLYGVAFLTHPAPAMLLTLTFIIIELSRLKEISFSQFLAHCLITGGVALLVSSPYLYILIVEHQFDIKNPAPNNFLGLTDPKLITDRVIGLLSPSTYLLLIGVISLIKQKKSIRQRFILIHSLTLTGLIMAYYLSFLVTDTPPLPFPGIHLLYYWYAWVSLLAGFGLSRAVFMFIAERPKETPLENRVSKIFNRFYVAFAIIALLAIVNPLYQTSDKDFAAQRPPDGTLDVADWIRQNSTHQDVFLASPALAQFIVVPNNRPVVVTAELWSNPYVNFEVRLKDSEAMFTAINTGECETALQKINQYGVRFVLVEDPIESCAALLQKVFEKGDLQIYAIQVNQ